MTPSTGYTANRRAVFDPIGRARPRARRLPPRSRRPHAVGPLLRADALARAAAEALRRPERDRAVGRRLTAGDRRRHGPRPERARGSDRRARAHGPRRPPARPGRPPPLSARPLRRRHRDAAPRAAARHRRRARAARAARRRRGPGPRRAARQGRRRRRPRAVLDGDPPEREPALELLLVRQPRPDLGLDLQLALGVALLAAARRHERVPGAALVVVDEVDRLARGVLEREDGAEDPVAVAADAERVAHGVNPDGEVLELGVLYDHPAVADLVAGGLDARADLVPGALQDLLHLGDDRAEVARAERLEDDRRAPARLDVLLGLEVDVRGREREQPVRRRALDLVAAEQRVEQAHYRPVPCSWASSRWSAAMRFSIGGCVAKMLNSDCLAFAGKM